MVVLMFMKGDKMRAIDRINPVVTFTYFFITLFVTMFSMNPVVISISFCLSLGLLFAISNFKTAFKTFAFTIAIILLSTLLNPIFVHEGMTKLFYMNGKPITLESIFYGLTVGMMISSSFVWLKSFNIVITSEKIVFLFGNFLPKFATILNLSVGMIPKFKKQYKEIDENLFALGLYGDGNIFRTLKVKMRLFSTLTTWGIESSVVTADSMKARGFGIARRTKFSIFQFQKSDMFLLILVFVLGMTATIPMFFNVASFYFYPKMKALSFNIDLLVYIFEACFMSLFAILETGEKIKWHFLKSKI